MIRGENGQPYNIGNPNEEYSILALANTLVNLYPELNLKVIMNNESDNKAYLKSPIQRNSPNITKANKLNWSPVVGVKEGFKRTIESFK